jgi:hypothetical protein
MANRDWRGKARICQILPTLLTLLANDALRREVRRMDELDLQSLCGWKWAGISQTAGFATFSNESRHLSLLARMGDPERVTAWEGDLRQGAWTSLCFRESNGIGFRGRSVKRGHRAPQMSICVGQDGRFGEHE